ncbi:DUF2797 domain-containing protein [Streptomyces sp. SP18CS02]|uniref:DUF2797 domain-containing protein n=1 Tax=Streptomyces sp. SP18CS02 TaxID=3002531 RepID=UPI002E791DD2|nr:DUF2797 domain-containing protein [Streptomyces sp. SP18CS02]MEE1754251.1 DUF2797 domain-containing protein [Streptomyces sp. SP18CS02]
MAGWRCRGLRWPQGRPVLVWDRERLSALEYGRAIGFRAVGERRCPGARGNPCPLDSLVAGRSTGGLCAECARLDRLHSVAADTIADDRRVYRVYLAWFGPGMVKVGITAEQRGDARLLEQGAVAFSWLGRGPLMAARRAEEVLGTALGVPDRIPYAAKRAVRAVLPGEGERAAEVEDLYRRAVGVPGWEDTLERLGPAVVDHARAFGLAGLGAVDGAVAELVDGGAVRGTLMAAAGPDLHLAVPDGRALVLDTRLLTGWELVSAGSEESAGGTTAGGATVPVAPLSKGPKGPNGSEGVQGGLF